MRLLAFPAFLAPAALLLAGCEGDAGDNIQTATENVASAVEDFAEEAGDEIGNQIESAENRLQDGNESNSADADNRQ